MYISFNDMMIFLAIFIGVCLGIAVLVLLVIALVRLIKTIGKINKIMEDNAENIGETVKKIPELTESIGKTLTSVGETLYGVNDAFFETKSSNDTMTSVLGIVESVANLAVYRFSKKK